MNSYNKTEHSGKEEGIFVSFCGTKITPVENCFDDLYKEGLIGKAYLLYTDFNSKDDYDNTINSKDQCNKLAEKLWDKFCKNNPVKPRGDLNQVYGNETEGDRVFTIFMTGEQNFNLDYVLNRIIKIYTENNNKKMHFNITNGNQVFTCAIAIAAHMVGGALHYVDKGKKDYEATRCIKDCDAPSAYDLSKPEWNILKQIGT